MKSVWSMVAAAGLGACLQAAPAPTPTDSAFVLFDAKSEARGGTCRDNPGFVAEVRAIVERQGATHVRCLAELPEEA